MKMRDSRPFLQQLRETGAYETPAANLRVPRRGNSCWTSTEYNWHAVFMAMYTGSELQKRGLFTDQAWADVGTHLFWESEKFGTPVSFEGFLNRAQHKGPVVYVCNHMSLYETFAFPAAMLAFGELAIVLKESLLKVPILGNVFKSKRVIPLGRTNPREDLKKVMELGERFLGEGASIVLYPQGARYPFFDVKHFNTMGLKLAQKAGVPVVPIAGQTSFLGVGKYTKDFGPVDTSVPVRFACGPCVVPTRENARELHQQCISFIADTLERWGRVQVIR